MAVLSNLTTSAFTLPAWVREAAAIPPFLEKDPGSSHTCLQLSFPSPLPTVGMTLTRPAVLCLGRPSPAPPQREDRTWCRWPRRLTHLPSEAVEMEQGLQVSALPLGCHVEVCQPGLEGLLGGGEGYQVWELCLSCPFLRSAQLGRLLGQFQALAILGLRRKRTLSSHLSIHPAVRSLPGPRASASPSAKLSPWPKFSTGVVIRPTVQAFTWKFTVFWKVL